MSSNSCPDRRAQVGHDPAHDRDPSAHVEKMRDDVTRLLLVDLDDTLVERSAAFGAWAYDFAVEHGRPEDAEWMVASDRRGLRPRPELAAMIAERLGHADVAELLGTLRRGLVDPMSLAPATAAALRTARAAGWSIVIVTNGTEAQQTAKIGHLGLDHLVDGWVISEAAGVRKPDPEIFALAAARAGMPLDGGWMVGDSASADIAGGAAVGSVDRLAPVRPDLGRAGVHPDDRSRHVRRRSTPHRRAGLTPSACRSGQQARSPACARAARLGACTCVDDRAA